MKYYSIFLYIFFFRVLCVAQERNMHVSNEQIWLETSIPTTLSTFLENQFQTEKRTLSHKETLNAKLFKHLGSTDSVVFYCYTAPFISSHPDAYMYVQKGHTGKSLATFEELVDSVFSSFPVDSATRAISIIKAYAIHPDLYNYYNTEAMWLYETVDFKFVRRTYFPQEVYKLRCPNIDLQKYLSRSQIKNVSWVEKWQQYAFGFNGKYNLYSLFASPKLHIELIQSFSENHAAYSLFFLTDKPKLFELDDSESYIVIRNKKNNKINYLENLTFLSIVMEIVASPYIPNDNLKYELINKVRLLRDIIGVQTGK